jgi:hypothetical protein
MGGRFGQFRVGWVLIGLYWGSTTSSQAKGSKDGEFTVASQGLHNAPLN